MSRVFRWFFLLIILVSGAAAAQAQSPAPGVVSLRLEGALNPVWQETLERGLRTAQDSGAAALVVELDTPGGSVDLMEKLVQQLRAASLPVIIYVTPAGAMAASAGTLLTLAGSAAGMAPDTVIGAASPVGSQGEDIGQTLETKVKEVLKASARALTERRGAAATALAQEMIDDARAVSAREALEAGLIDAVAPTLTDLLNQLDGRSVQVQGREVTLALAGATVVPLPVSPAELLLNVLANANLVFLLLSIGVQAILIEISTPGGWVAGFIGVVCLALAVYGLGILPVNWFGAVFLVLAFVLFVLDLKAPTHGALTAAGAGSFIAGALVLFNSPAAPSFQRVSIPLVVGVGAALGLLFFGMMTLALRARHLPVRTGQEALVGQRGAARTALAPVGSVLVRSELWTARLEPDSPPVHRGDRVVVTSVEGIELRVRKAGD